MYVMSLGVGNCNFARLEVGHHISQVHFEPDAGTGTRRLSSWEIDWAMPWSTSRKNLVGWTPQRGGPPLATETQRSEPFPGGAGEGEPVTVIIVAVGWTSAGQQSKGTRPQIRGRDRRRLPRWQPQVPSADWLQESSCTPQVRL